MKLFRPNSLYLEATRSSRGRDIDEDMTDPEDEPIDEEGIEFESDKRKWSLWILSKWERITISLYI
jgi:hypothetical protein